MKIQNTPPINFEPGGFRYLKSVFQFSGGVAAQPGFALERVRLSKPLPLTEGFAAAEEHLSAIGRPTTAFCACELRSPEPFSEQAFVEFNEAYVGTLERWGLYRDGVNPVARTNVCPLDGPPNVPSLQAFTYTVPASGRAQHFVVAGGAEAREGEAEYRNSIIRLGDTSNEGLREKMRFVRAEQERRLEVLGFGWTNVSTTNVYSLHDVGPLLRDELFDQVAAPGGLTWHLASPPVLDCEFEMDASNVSQEMFLERK